MSMIRVGVAGATGYTGYELLRILARHPQTQVIWLTSEQNAGRKYSEVLPSPWDQELVTLEAALARTPEVDVVFMALPHAKSIAPVRAFHDAGVTVIDLSADYRLPDRDQYARWYGIPHTAPDLLQSAVYGLCEVNRQNIVGSRLIANPGCYPTSVNLALYPLAKAGWLQPQVIVDSKSGVSGAGRKAQIPYLYAEANENMSPYSVGYRHRHIAEMELVLGQANDRVQKFDITFVPHLAPLTQGILSTMYVSVRNGVSEGDIRSLYAETYAAEPFIQMLSPETLASIRHVSHSNGCAISVTPVHPDRSDATNYVVVSSIDNLIKGASGQAVQNMNIALGLAETAGLW